MSRCWGWAGLVAIIPLVGACATVPTGPSVMVMPGQGKSFEDFQVDDGACRQWAGLRTGISPGEAATSSGIASATVGTLLGAAAGAAIGAAAGNPALGAAAGAGGGLLMGSAVGVSGAQYSGYEAQRRYDMAYQQCMYAKGNQIPGVQRASRRGAPLPPPPPPSGSSLTPSLSRSIPPPPPGPPPPPPPGVSR